MSRHLVKCLKIILPDLILPSQTAFVKNGLLLENTILASELVNGYHKKQGVKKITIKVDIAKDFDTLSLEFLFACLEGLQVPSVFLAWLRACICTTSFMVGYNGTVNRAATKNKLKFHAKCKSTRITHLSFMDDLLIFTDGPLESLQQVLMVLREFELRSGLKVSMEKTSFVVS
ncbi:hypothetical protein YC2023_002684 [Brassica napus]